MRTINGFWCLSSNFGDALAPFIMEKISGRTAILVGPNEPGIKYMVTGSILNWDCLNGVVWGCGIANKDDELGSGLYKIIATRGPISAQAVIKAGRRSPEAIGDPALLLPKLYKPLIPKKKYKVGIFPHYVDSVIIANLIQHEDVLVINPLGSITDVINDIVSCEKIYSSSLHGLIAAHAYGIPACWVEFSNKLLGDGTKFKDYYLSVGEKTLVKPVDMRNLTNTRHLINELTPWLPNMTIDLNALWETCPFKI